MAMTARRRYNRYIKGMRRLKIDRNEHGSPYYHSTFRGGCVLSCPCFAPEADHGRGKEFSFFADTPTPFVDRYGDKGWNRRISERRAPTVEEWEDDTPFVPTRSLGWYSEDES